MKANGSKISSDDLRSAIARAGVHKYLVAAKARIHPVRLSEILNNRTRFSDALAERILDAVEQAAKDRRRLAMKMP